MGFAQSSIVFQLRHFHRFGAVIDRIGETIDTAGWFLLCVNENQKSPEQLTVGLRHNRPIANFILISCLPVMAIQ